MAKARPTTIAEYIRAAPKEAQKALREMRAILKEAAPQSDGGSEVGIAGVRREANSVRVRGIQIAPELHANPFRDEAVQEGARQIRDR